MPEHSPGRIRANRFNGMRQYSRSFTGSERGQLWLSLAALALSAVFLLTFVRLKASASAPGRLARPHAMLNDECAACHRPHNLSSTPTGFFNAGERWRDFTCLGCHGDAPHHPSMDETPAQRERACANCHHDHKGEGNLLASVGDQACVTCHHGPKKNPISSWASHPEFAALGQPFLRRMKFSHSLHLSQGLKDASGKVHNLDCASCHRLDRGSAIADRHPIGDLPRDAVMPPRADGRHMLPVVYDLHCKQCHPLTSSAGKESFALPHRVQPDALAAILRREITTRFIESGTTPDRIPVVSGRLDPRKREEVLSTLKGHIEARLDEAKNNLYREGGTCARCHDIENHRIKPPSIPTVWLPRARFSHVSHRATACLECHPGKTLVTGANKQPVVVEREPLLGSLPGIETCRECHGPRAQVTRAGVLGVRGGVRHTCTTCHSYHDAANPLHGIGAGTRDPNKRMTIHDFLKVGR